MCHIYMIVEWKYTLTQEIPYIMLSWIYTKKVDTK